MERLTEAILVVAVIVASVMYWLWFETVSGLYAPSQTQAQTRSATG